MIMMLLIIGMHAPVNKPLPSVISYSASHLIDLFLPTYQRTTATTIVLSAARDQTRESFSGGFPLNASQVLANSAPHKTSQVPRTASHGTQSKSWTMGPHCTREAC
jgi:hypothetical protein